MRSSTELGKTVLQGVLVIIALHYLIKFEQIREHGDFASLEIPEDDKSVSPLEIPEMEKFPESGPDKIPKIIHQTWKSTDIPQMFVPWVKSWNEHNPDWEYMFWTDESARKFIAKKYPDFLPVYDGYLEPIRRADAMRYFILYEFGGVYADLDLESLQSMNPIIRKYHCFFGQEPYIHSILDSNFENLVINAMMGCRKGHPFMKQLMNNLPRFAHMWNVLDSTGPHFVTLLFNDYQNEHHYSSTHVNGTYLTPPRYFFPSTDPSKRFSFHSQCSQYSSLSDNKKRACLYLKKTSLEPVALEQSFTDHHWVHTYVFMFRLPLRGPVDIRLLNPNVRMYLA